MLYSASTVSVVGGIAGILEFRDGRTVPGHLLEAMGKVIEHRGPGQVGLWHDGPVGLLARRLKAVDPAPTDAEPLANEDGAIRLVYDGEILNHEPLRRELEVLGHKFRSRRDGEVVVHAYEAWGPRCVERFRGCFAFGLWDGARRQLLLARDRIGIRPLYYAERPDRVLFASEISAILEHPDVPRAIDLQSAYHHVGYGFVPGPATMFRGIVKVPPGAILLARDGQVELQPYWELRFTDSLLDAGTLAQRLREICRDAVRAWMPANVPAGVFLSGSLGSAAVLAFAREVSSGALATFAVAADDPFARDRELAREAARHYRTDHREVGLSPATPALLEEVAGYLDEPLADPSALALFLLCREARRDVAVCLSDEGGPAASLGDDHSVGSGAERLGRLLPGSLRARLVEPLIARARRRVEARETGPMAILRRFLEDTPGESEESGTRRHHPGSAARDTEVFREAALRAVTPDRFGAIRRILGRCNSTRRLDREVFVETRLTLPDSVLMALDRMSAAHALEVRVPLLDHLLVEFAATIPARLRSPELPGRGISRRALRGVLPRGLLAQPRPPRARRLERWLRHELKDYAIRLLNGSAVIRAHFDRDGVNWMMAEHLARRADHHHTLWALVGLALWHRRFIEA